MRSLRREAVIVLMGTILAVGCQRHLTDEEKSKVAALTREQGEIARNITATEEETKKFGGLVQALAQVRLDILKTNEALVTQQIHAIETGAKVVIQVSAQQPDPTKAEQIHEEMLKVQEEIARTRRESSGGLIGALNLANVATQENTLAMLEQGYLAAKYGLAPFQTLPTAVASASPTSSPPPPEVSLASIAGDGPFGFTMGMKADQFGAQLNALQDGYYSLTTAPRPHPSFERYILQLTDNQGLCWVKGIGHELPSNSFGLSIRSAFEELESGLDERYGRGKKTDQLIPGSIWSDGKDWMMALRKKERYLFKIWDQKSGSSLSNSLTNISLMAVADSGDEGHIEVEYSFANAQECDRALKERKNKNL